LQLATVKLKQKNSINSSEDLQVQRCLIFCMKNDN
jgi:hypothetical protein